MVPTTRKEAPTGNTPMRATPHKAVTNRFPQVGGNRTSEAPGVIFDPTTKGVETPPPNDSLKASLSPPVGGRFQWGPVIDLSRLSTFLHNRKVQNRNSRVHQDLCDSRGIDIVDGPIRRLPSHPHPSKLKEIPKVLPQVAGVPVHLHPFRTGHSPPGLYNDCKGSEANGPLQRTQTSPIPERLANQVPVSGRSPSEHSGSGRPNPVLGLHNKSGKIRTETYSGVFVRGLRIPSRFSPCKTHSREMAQTSGFDPMTRVKTCFDCKMCDVANWVACLDGENGPGTS